MHRSKKLSLMLLTMLLSVSCDQTTKLSATNYLADREPLSFFGNTLRLVYSENPGAFLGMGEGLPEIWRLLIFQYGIGLVLLTFFAYIVWDKRMRPGTVFAAALVIGGGLGNLLNRIFFDGVVVDFLILDIGPLRTGIFNIADMAVLLGAGLFVYFSSRIVEPDPPEQPVDG